MWVVVITLLKPTVVVSDKSVPALAIQCIAGDHCRLSEVRQLAVLGSDLFAGFEICLVRDFVAIVPHDNWFVLTVGDV